MTQSLGVGAQFGGKFFCHDVRVIRIPRHGASLPIGLGVSCSADDRCSARSRKTASISRRSSTIRRSICPRSTVARRRGRQDRSRPADEGNSGDAVAISIKTRSR